MEIINQSKEEIIMNKIGKRGQITIFVIIAILLVVVIVLLFVLYNGQIKSIINKNSEEPNVQIEHCINQLVLESSDKIIEIGGYVDKAPLIKEFEYKEVPYLCYTPLNREKCKTVEPVIVDHLENEIYKDIFDKVDKCFTDLKSELESQNYDVSLERNFSLSIELLPGKIKVGVSRKISIKRNDVLRNYNSFNSNTQSPLYNIFIVIQEITRQESKYCNSDYPLIMRITRNVEIEKFQTGDQNKIYDVKDLLTGKIVRFAVRGCVIPAPTG